MVGSRHRHRLGPGRHAHPRPGRVLRPGRLRDGDAPQARRRRPRRAARLHAALRPARRVAAVVAAVRQPVVRAAGHRAAADGGGVRPRFAGLPPPGTRRLLRHPQPGARRRDGDPARRPAGHHRRHQRPHRHPGLLRLRPGRPGQPADGLLHHRRRPARVAGAGPAAHPQPLRRTAGGGPRRRGAGPLPRLRPGGRQARRLRDRRRDGRPGRGAVRPGGGDHLTGADRDRPVHRVRHRRRGGWPGDPARSGARRGGGGLGAYRPVGAFPGHLDVPPGVAVRAGGGVPAGRPGVAVGAGPAAPVATRPVRGGGGGAGRWSRPRTGRRCRRHDRPATRRPVRTRPAGDLRRLHRRRRGRPRRAARRHPVPDRPQRGGQDHTGRRRHRAGPGHRLGPLRRAGTARPRRAPHRPARHRPHLPDRLGLRGADGAAEPRHRRRRQPELVDAGPPAQRDPRRGGRRAGDDRADRSGRPAGRARWRTGRSSGWRSACCWSRTPGCCCSTSRSPG